MWIDTHCHLDFIVSKEEQLSKINFAQLDYIICPSADQHSFEKLVRIHEQNKKCVYALGYHPLYLKALPKNAVEELERAIQNFNPIAVGEIGLDFYVPDYDKEMQITYFNQQLALAQTYNLPVILHVRSAIDEVIKILKNYPHIKGIVHAFNGSRQQADQLIQRQFKLGFGGAMTYPRALHIQRLATELPIESIVLETDAPDMNPSWLTKDLDNHPNQLPQIAAFFAQLRNISLEKLALQMKQNLQEVMPQIGIC